MFINYDLYTKKLLELQRDKVLKGALKLCTEKGPTWTLVKLFINYDPYTKKLLKLPRDEVLKQLWSSTLKRRPTGTLKSLRQSKLFINCDSTYIKTLPSPKTPKKEVSLTTSTLTDHLFEHHLRDCQASALYATFLQRRYKYTWYQLPKSTSRVISFLKELNWRTRFYRSHCFRRSYTISSIYNPSIPIEENPKGVTGAG